MSFRIQNWKTDTSLASLLLLASFSSPATAQFQSASVELSAFNNTNIGLARTEHMNDYGLQLRLAGQSYFERSTGNGIFLSSDIAVTGYDIYTKLNRTELSGQIGYVKKFGIGFDKPRISALLGVQYRNSDSAIRSGWSISPTIQYTKNLSERTSISASAQYYQFNAENRLAVDPGAGWVAGDDHPGSVKNIQLHLGYEWAWTPNTYLAFNTSYIQGDFSSLGLPTSRLAEYSDAVSLNDVCGGRYYQYRYSGKGYVAGGEIIHAFSQGYEVSLGLQRSLVDADKGVGYAQNFFDFSFSKRF